MAALDPPHPLLVRAANLYYEVMHIAVFCAVLAWIIVRHRSFYPWARTSLVMVTGACLLIELIPVAPPRFLSGDGFVDLGAKYHQSIYSTALLKHLLAADSLSAMPSVHVAWAGLAALLSVYISRSPWRWLLLLHPLTTFVVVVVTANHFWADGIVAMLLLTLMYPARTVAERLSARALTKSGAARKDTSELPRAD